MNRTTMINILIMALFFLSAAVAVYIVINSAAPWALISAYWITLAVKNGVDWINNQKGLDDKS